MDDESAPNQMRTALAKSSNETGNDVTVSPYGISQGVTIATPQCSEKPNDNVKDGRLGDEISSNCNSKSMPSSPLLQLRKPESCLPLAPDKINIEQEVLAESRNSSKEPSNKSFSTPTNRSIGKDENNGNPSGTPSSRKSLTPFFKYNPNKVHVKFLFANRDGINVLVEFNAEDTVGEVKRALVQAWPDVIPPCSGVDALRLICMGRGVLMPDTRTLKDCGVPIFESHATPVNVSVRPPKSGSGGGGRNDSEKKKRNDSTAGNSVGAAPPSGGRPYSRDPSAGGPHRETTGQGCACVLL